MFNFFNDCKNYGRKLQSTANILILMIILFLLNIFNIIDISWIAVILLPFIVDIIAGICTLSIDEKKKGGVSKNESKK